MKNDPDTGYFEEGSGLILESQIQDYLANNLQLFCGPSLQLVGIEHPVPFGRIDVLARRDPDEFWVFEIKRGAADRDAVGQVQSYMGAVQQAHRGSKVRGVIVAAEVTEAAVAALLVAPDISFCRYQMHFSFSEVSAFSPGKPQTVKENPTQVRLWEARGGSVSSYSAFCKHCGKRQQQVMLGNKTLCFTCESPL